MKRNDEHIHVHRNFHKQYEHEYFKDLHKQHREMHRLHRKLQKRQMDLHRYHKHVRYFRPVMFGLNLLIWCFVYKYAGLKVVSVAFATLLSTGGILQLFYLMRLEKRIIKPIDKLRCGVEEIAKGNYNIKVESDITNEISLLIDSFNDMAQKLQKSEKMKSEYEENRKMLIANISHDLKTPITSVQGYIEAIVDGAVTGPENVNKYLQVIYRNTVYMNKLIDDLFLFSKLDMQKLDFHFDVLHVRAFMSDLMEEFKFEIEDKHFKFEYHDRMENDFRVNIDRKRFHQAVRNIIGNAVKYGTEKDLTISVKMYERNEEICIDIEDNGPGIPKEKIPYIFDRFYRVDTERTKDFMSTGLGLAIAKELVEAHHGKITVKSEENKGTCFTIALPIVKES